MENNEYIAITGASSGIGLEVAKAFAGKGKNLIIIARNKEGLDNLKNEIIEDNPKVLVEIKVCDLSVNENVYKLYNDLKAFEIEAWINNAGLGSYSNVANQDLNKIEKMLHLNIEALTILSALYVRDYKDVPNTQLINISSAGGYTIVPNAITYCATKFYVSTFTEGLARELIETNSELQAKVLAPAATKTSFGKVANDVSDYDYDKVFRKYHSSEEMAGFLIKLYESNEVVGMVDRETFEFKLTSPIFEYAGNSKYNQKN